MNAIKPFGLDDGDVEKIRNIFRSLPQISKVIIYGSRALGNFKPGSDIDLTVVTNETSLSFLFTIETAIDDLLLPYKVDLSLYSLLDNVNLKDHISRRGIVFYIQGS